MDFIHSFKNSVCRFLVHRYLGDYLKTAIKPEDLEIQLANGSASVKHVNLNVEHINGIIEPLGIVSVVEGFVKEITIHAPFSQLHKESTVISVQGLNITVAPMKDINLLNPQDLVSSFIGTIASRMETSVTAEDLPGNASNESIEQFASVIDHVVSRVKMIFEGITIRLEVDGEISTALEIQIQEIEVIDEQLETEKNTEEVITSQPSATAIPDMSKILFVRDVKVFTDIWTAESSVSVMSGCSDGHVVNPDLLGSMATSSMNFQSCYSHFSSSGNGDGDASKSFARLQTRPIQIAHFWGEQHTIKIKIHNSGVSKQDGAFGKKIDMDMNMSGSLFFYLTPSQLVLLQDLLSRLVPKATTVTNANSSVCTGGRPMQKEHFDQITNQLHNENAWGLRSMGLASWQNENYFQELAKPGNRTEAKLVPVSLDNDDYTDFSPTSSYPYGMECIRDSDTIADTDTQRGSNSTLVEKQGHNPDIFVLYLRVTKLCGVITHDDPLSRENTQKALAEHGIDGIGRVMEKLERDSMHFFKTVAAVPMKNPSLSNQQHAFNNVCLGDHLRVLGELPTLRFRSEANGARDGFEVSTTFAKFDMVESLTKESVANGSSGLLIDLISFADGPETTNFAFHLATPTNPEQENIDYSIELNLQPCRSEIDISIIDRLHQLIVCHPFFLPPKPSPYEKGADDFAVDSEKCKIRFYCRKWEVDLRVPIADLTGNGVPFWQRNVHDEITRIEFSEVMLEMPKFRLTDIANFASIHINCRSMTASLLGDCELLQCQPQETKFLHATDLSGVGDAHVCLTIAYDFRNKCIQANTSRLLDPLSRSMSQSMHGSFFTISDVKEGPFAKQNEFVQGTRVVQAGSRLELLEFSDSCRKNSDVTVELSLSRVHVYFPSKKFFEVLYNRFANDFALYVPKAPAFQPSVSALNTSNDNGHVFKEFRTSEEDGIDNSEFLDPIDSLEAKSNRSHTMSFNVRARKGNVLLGAVGGKDGAKFKSQIGSDLEKCDFFLVFGYHGDPNLLYMYIAAEKAAVFHRNLLTEATRPFNTNVTDIKGFMLRSSADVFAEAITTPDLVTVYDDNNVAVCIRMLTHFDEDLDRYFKDIFLTARVRNTLIQFRPFTNPDQFWVQQLIDFCTIDDYGVPGYEWPQATIDINFNIGTSVLAYDHSSVVPDSPLRLRAIINSCDLSGNFVESQECFCFRAHVEDASLYMGMKKKDNVRFKGFGDGAKPPPPQHWVKFVAIDRFEVIVNVFLGLREGSVPSIDVFCSNEAIRVWACSDMVVEFVNMLSEFVQSEYAGPLRRKQSVSSEELTDLLQNTANGRKSTHTNEQHGATIDAEAKDRMMNMMSSAMQENPSSASPSPPPSNPKRTEPEPDYFDDEALIDGIIKNVNASGSKGSTDDEFILVDEIPGSGITHSSGAPRIRFLNDTYKVEEAFLTIPNKDTLGNLIQLPEGHPNPVLKYQIHNVTIMLYLYGGNDLGEGPSEPKTYSQWESQRESNDCMREQCKSMGGPFRDHTVCVQAKVSKISFTSMVFDATAPTLSLNMLTVKEVEVLDHLLVSQINKLFYQFTNEFLPPRSYASFLSICMIEDHNREGKLKISMLPMRLNIDQDTLEFLTDFFSAIGDGVKLPVEPASDPALDEPVFSVPGSAHTFVPLVDYENGSNNLRQPQFSRRSSVSSEDSFEVKRAGMTSPEQPVDMNAMLTSMYDEPIDQVPSPMISTSAEAAPSVAFERRASTNSNASRNNMKETFFTSFQFSPACTIRLDYIGKRVKMDHEQGKLVGLLYGLSNLHCTQLTLQSIDYEKGLLGYGKCAQLAIDEWVTDIKRNQIPNVLGSFGPITSIVEIGKGIMDLFYIPLTEYRKEDGRIVKGIQRGANSFGVSTASAAIDATQWFASMVNTLAEIAFDIVTPDYHGAQIRRQEEEAKRGHVPNDIREGFHMAFDTVYDGVLHSAKTIKLATDEDRAHGQLPLRGILRHATPMAVKPLVIASQATMHVLNGLRSQLRPESYREEKEKWRRKNDASSKRH